MAKDLITWESSIGTLSDGLTTWPATARIGCASNGSLTFHFDPIPLDKHTAALRHVAMGTHGPVVPYLVFAGTAKDGTALTSEYVFFTKIGTPISSAGAFLQLEAEAATLLATPPNAVVHPQAGKYSARYLTVAMRGYGATIKEFDGIVLNVSAPTDVANFEDLAGHVHLEQTSAVALDDWLSVVDRRVANLLRVVSLGQGRIIDWSIREVWVDGLLHSIYFTGPKSSGPGAEPAFHHLNMEPVIDLALAHFDTLHEHYNLYVVIEWLLIHSVYAEVRFLTAATAFEHLLSADPETSGAMMSKDMFNREVRWPIEAIFDDVTLAERWANELQVSAETISNMLSAMKAKLGSLNSKSLRDKLDAFVGRHGVPLSDVEISIHELLRTRNQLVHGSDSLHDGEESLTVRAIMMREVLRRTILALLGFEGQFHSYARGPEWLTFCAPPTVNAQDQV